MEQIFFIALVAVVGVVRLLSQLSEKKKNEVAARRAGLPDASPPRSTAPVPRAPLQTEEEPIRRFMEALGVPTSQPPVVARERRAEPPRKRTIHPVDPFPRPPMVLPQAVPPPLPPATLARVPELQVAAEEERSRMAERRRERAAKFLTPAEFEVRTLGAAPIADLASTQSAASVTARLGSAALLRDAIVLREILDPPRGLQPL
ncbi:MAG: hypothetical protein ACR2ID_10200 [Chthoniobacterales bacterium]